MTSTTNFATGTAQGAAVAHTYNVGAIFSIDPDGSNPELICTSGVIVSQLHQDHYGVVLVDYLTCTRYRYRYTVMHACQMHFGGEMPVEDQLRLKIVSMIYRNPNLDKNIEIIREIEGKGNRKYERADLTA